MNNAVFGIPLENVRKHRKIKLVTTDKRRNQLVSEPNYHTIKWFSENLVAIEMRKTKVKMNKPIYLGMAILDISKIAMYEFWYDKSGVPLEKQKEIFNRLVEERALEFSDVKDKIDPNNLVYVFKTEGNRPKDFGNNQMPLKLFEDLRDGNVSPKDQARFKSNLSEIKIGGKKSPNQKNTIKNITNFLIYKKKLLIFLEIFFFTI